MGLLKLVLATALIGGMAASDAAWADRGHSRGGQGGHGQSGHFHRHSRVGVVVGAPLFYPWWYDWPGPYYAPPPQIYIEQGNPAGYWYYCNDPAGYYPGVGTCPAGWIKVEPQAPR